MALYPRLLGRDDDGNQVGGRIEIRFFGALLGEVARGALTKAQANATIADVTGQPLAGDEITDAGAMLDSILAPPSAAGKLARAAEIGDVLVLAVIGRATGYYRPADVRARLGL